MDLPPGPRAPAIWQTMAWMARPGAFLRRVHARFGDPATIRTYWTEEPMVLLSSPDAVRAVFRLDPAIAPAGQSWEFLRPFAGEHSILLLDGEEHLRERRLMARRSTGSGCRAFAPLVADLARAELATWRGRSGARADARADPRDHPSRGVGAARGRGGAVAAGDRRCARDGARSHGCPQWRWCARTSVPAARGGASGLRSSASTRCCSSCRAPAGRAPRLRLDARRAPGQHESTATRPATVTSATSSWRCSSGP